MKTYEVSGHRPSLLPEGYDFLLAWSDEFDGDALDRSKWDYRLCMMGKRHPAWTDKGVRLEDSCAVFSVFEEDGEVVSSQLQTGYNFMDEPVTKTTFLSDDLQWPIGKLHEDKFTHRYGYYECCCRLQRTDGWWSAFWLQSPVIGASLDPKRTGSEVDVMESFVPGNVFAHFVHTGGYGLDARHFSAGGQDGLSPDDFHTFGVLWLPDRYVFYVDGKENGTITDAVSGTDQFLLISTETKGYRLKGHRPTEAAYVSARTGDTFLVDHVRVFDLC